VWGAKTRCALGEITDLQAGRYFWHPTGLPADTFAALEPDRLQLAKTASRSTLGFMTEMAFELGSIITDKGGLRRSDIPELNHVLRRMLWNRGDYVRPIELVKQHLGART
jgi:hypothetical protein